MGWEELAVQVLRPTGSYLSSVDEAMVKRGPPR